MHILTDRSFMRRNSSASRFGIRCNGPPRHVVASNNTSQIIPIHGGLQGGLHVTVQGYHHFASSPRRTSHLKPRFLHRPVSNMFHKTTSRLPVSLV